ncbi:myelin-associated glycoprotein [Triplophysa rosa]|uniref:myelin-associated glycoprotein n=1 Tax=Triplophysa rosa TaxID=992332 RepID=UPI002546136A|nr:myelin-associated glycoprotein [Triplophysa rosa]
MVVFQSCLFAFILYLRAYSASDNEWNANIPKSVVGLSGSCVVIPCTYNYPSHGKTYTGFTGIWYKGDSDIIYHEDTSKINSKFKDRTSLDYLQQKNCTLKISSLQHDDPGQYMFRIEIKDLNMFSYQENKVSITVKDSPELPIISVDEEVTSQKEVTAICVVSHSCPSEPPRLTWSHKGTTTSYSQPLEDGQWKLTSSLTFTPSREDHNKPLSCSAEFTPAKTASNNKKLKVKYPPFNVHVQSTPVKENESIQLNCSSDSNPPPDSFQWFSLNGSPLANGRTYRLNHVTRYTEAISCTATNTEGKTSSGPQRINVLYPPYNVHVQSKSQVKENESVDLTCSSDSNPPPDSFQWFGSTGSLLENRSTYRLNHVTRYTEAISCTATNTEGKTSSGPQRIKVLYPPEIKNGSSCESETFIVCVCIVDSNPPSEVKWLGPSSAFPSSSVEQNGSLTIFTLQGWLGFPDTVHCSASNSEGNSVMTLSVPHHGLIIYLVVATVAVVVILVVISACAAKRRCGRRPAQSVLDVKNDHNELKTTPKSDISSQERQKNDIYIKHEVIDQPVYKNFECDDGYPSCEQDEDEAVYANS